MSAQKWRLFVIVAAVGLSSGLSVCPTVALADAVTETFTFTATGLDPPGGPVAIQTGSFTLTFDPTLTYIDAPLSAISLTVDGHTYSLSDTGFFTNPPGAPAFELGFGAPPNGLNGVGAGANDFELAGQVDASGNVIPGTWAYCYGLASSPNVGWCAGGDLGGAGSSVVVESKPASVTSAPEPPVIVLLGFGLACVGLAAHRRRRGVELAAQAA